MSALSRQLVPESIDEADQSFLVPFREEPGCTLNFPRRNIARIYIFQRVRIACLCFVIARPCSGRRSQCSIAQGP